MLSGLIYIRTYLHLRMYVRTYYILLNDVTTVSVPQSLKIVMYRIVMCPRVDLLNQFQDCDNC